MAPTILIDDDELSDHEPTLSATPATAVLDQVEVLLGLAGKPASSNNQDSETFQRPPKRRRNSRGIEYVEVTLQKEGSRSAFYWQHGYEAECQRPNKKGKKETYWVCSKCHTFKAYGRTHGNHIKEHLKSMHGIIETLPLPPQRRSVIELQRHAPAASFRSELSDADNHIIMTSKFHSALISFICCTHSSFSIVESEYFQALLTTVSDKVPDLLPTSHNTVKSWVVESYKQRKQQIRSLLRKSRSCIHLSFDGWTSDNQLPFLAVVGHFMSAKYTVDSILLAFREVKGPHTGANFASIVEQVACEYDISQETIGTFVLDNATPNDACVDTLGKSFGWSKEECKQRRLRCFGHIINLVAQAFIFGAESEIFEQTLDLYEKDVTDSNVKLWELRGPVGKLHYIVVYIRRTPQRRQAFAAGGEDCDPSKLVPTRDNDTRWNSSYRMIKRALKLRKQFDFYCFNARSIKPGDDGLLPAQLLIEEDWYILTQVADALYHFDYATTRLEGLGKKAEFGAMWEVIPMIEELQEQLILLQQQYPLSTTFKETELDNYSQISEDDRPGANPATEFMTESVNCAFTKLKKYYDLTDRSTWYIAGLVLNPTLKWEYLKDRWEADPKWLRAATGKVNKLWQQYKITPESSNTGQSVSIPRASNQAAKKEDRLVNSMYRWKHKKETEALSTQKRDQYQEYLAEDPIDPPPPPKEGEEEGEGVVIPYWRGVEHKWPELARFAYDALSIPAMSTECERCFSSGSKTIEGRWALDGESIEACECQGQWIRRTFV
jgi:hypothetical protein